MTDLLHFLSWYLIISFTGLATLPLGFRFFSRLPSRGFALLRPLGLLLWGFIFWLLASLGMLQNDLGGVLLAFAGLVFLSVGASRGGKLKEIITWVKINLRLILVTESLFFVAFLIWTLVRGMNPDVAYTEKPMELAFINSILRSPTFPPQDPWLSGYAISYYYFGYVLIAMLTRVSGIASAVAFNLSSSLWFTLTATALYGIVYDLVFAWQDHRQEKDQTRSSTFARQAGFLGPLYVLVASTFEGVLEFLHAGGVFWRQAPDGTWVSKFWNWLAISDLDQPPTLPLDWIPSRPSGWLWWRGSRVLQDLNLANSKIEVIDEFPFFSYLLSDLHPHVLAMPFVLIAIAICLNFFLGADQFFAKFKNVQSWMRNWTFWLTALILGSLAFLNTWDFPIYVGLFCFTWAFIRFQKNGWKFKIVWELIKNGLIFGVSGVLIFLPFYLGFASQAGGFLPSMEFMTRGVHFWILFGVLLVPLVSWLIYYLVAKKQKKELGFGIKFSIITLTGLFVLSVLYGLLLFGIQNLGSDLSSSTNPLIVNLGMKMITGGSAFSGVHGNYPASEVLSEAFLRRVRSPGTWLTLGGMLAAVIALLISKRIHVADTTNDQTVELTDQPPDVEKFILILMLFGLILTIFPEFFYLRDQFGWRMNTIFKFYFQAWILWGICAAVASTILFKVLKKWKGILFQIFWILTILGGLAYPAIMLWEKTNHYSFVNWTLNGNNYIKNYTPDEYDAFLWLQQAPLGVVSEAIGGSYTDYARVSTRSGQPTVLGWPGHESQWRGGGEEMGSRLSDIQTLYETKSWPEAAAILERYNIRYVYVGNLENATYRLETGKFDSMLEPVYTNQSVIIYEVPTHPGELQP